jgi:hypothetical protein
VPRRLLISRPRASLKMLVECDNRIPEQRTLNPRVRSRWLLTLSLFLRDLAVAAHATRRAGQRRSRLRYQGQRSSPFPMFRAPGEDQTCAASSPGTYAEHPALPGTRKAVRRFIGVTRRGSPQARGSGMAVRTPTRGATPAIAGRPARGTATRMQCRHASRTAAGRATRRQPPCA